MTIDKLSPSVDNSGISVGDGKGRGDITDQTEHNVKEFFST